MAGVGVGELGDGSRVGTCVEQAGSRLGVYGF